MSYTDYEYRDADELQAALCEGLRAQLADALEQRGRAVLALAGGRTPLPIYAGLARAALDWGRVTLLPTDERCVPHDHPACNLRALREAFAPAAGVRFVALTRADGEPDASEAFARDALRALPEPFDAVLLGMGMDAHTASLFPGAARLRAGLDPDGPDALRVDPVPPPPEAPFPRITLGAARLRRSRALHLALQGEAKRQVFLRAVDAEPSRAPIAAFLQAGGTRLHVHWSA